MDPFHSKFSILKSSHSSRRFKKITDAEEVSHLIFVESEVMNNPQAHDDSVILELASLLSKPTLSPLPYARSPKFHKTCSPNFPTINCHTVYTPTPKIVKLSKLQPSRCDKLYPYYGIRREYRYLTADVFPSNEHTNQDKFYKK